MVRRALSIGGALGLIVVGAVAWWRRHPRVGAGLVNRVVDPWLVRSGVVEGSRGELGLLEHVGRTTGTVRITPIHPVPTADGFRIIAPLGIESQWARNVIAAGHCRLQSGGVVHELDEPRIVMPSEVEGLPRLASRVMDWLGFRYLVLHQFAEHEGSLDQIETRVEATQAVATSAPATLEAAPTA
jgi:deazaflavin-dependent oxidoreductase (nitroreductase family)